MTKFRIVETTVCDKAEQLTPLLQMHRDEIVTNETLATVSPNWAMYRALEANGSLISLLAYCDDEIVGYSVSILSQHPHFMGLTYAHGSALFLAPAFRHGGLGLQLIRATKECAKAHGAKMLMVHAFPGTTLDKILPRMGGRVEEIMYSMEV